MKVLVTGGSGFLGTHLRRIFSAADLSRRGGFDVLNLNDAQIVENYDLVIHLAALLDKSTANADNTFLTNVEGTINVLRSMRPGAAFIFASTKDVYGAFADDYELVPETCATDYDGQSPLEWSKLIAEKYVQFYAAARDFRSCIFRLSTVYAPATPDNEPNFVTHYLNYVNTGEPLRLPLGGAPVRDLLHVEDFAAACRAFAESNVRHGLYNLGGGQKNAVSLRELVTKLERLTGAQATFADADTAQPVPLNYVSDLTKITAELGWQPKISLDNGLQSLLQSEFF